MTCQTMPPASDPTAAATAELGPAAAAAALRQVQEMGAAVRAALAPLVVGQESVIEDLLVAVLCGGHCLLEGVPGLAKTLMVKSLARAIDLDCGRVQFTPDLLPSDLLGTDMLMDAPTAGRRMEFRPGPIFQHLVLADEINRAPPKTQSALLEAMQERQVTIGGSVHPLPDPFCVLATRNPIDQEGTYPLPEGQLDRFLMLVQIDYPTRDEEIEVVRRTTGPDDVTTAAVVSRETLVAAKQTVRMIPIGDHLLEEAVRLVRATRPGRGTAPAWLDRLVEYGAGPRGAQALVLAGKARAALAGRPCVTPADLQRSAPAVLRHRIVTRFESVAEGLTADTIIGRLLAEFLGAVG
jgi:MoxR-like ATPase